MNAVDILKYGHLWVHRHLNGLSLEEWELPNVCGIWSTKEIIAHLASFELLLVEVLENTQEVQPTPTLDQLRAMDGDSFNAVQVNLRNQRPVADVLGEYDDHYRRAAVLLTRIPPEYLRTPGTIPWYGIEYALDDWIVYQYYGHKREHMAQVAMLRDRLGK